MSEPDYTVSGLPTLSTRFNIKDFSEDPLHLIQWSLYVRALAKIQSYKRKDTPLGYYPIAGIHGWPDEQCTHHRSIFLPWHRVYILLIEQTIVAEATKLAGLAPSSVRALYLEQASHIRQPYWDWGHTMALPDIVSQETVDIIIPERDLLHPVTVPNPLYTYVFTDPLPPNPPPDPSGVSNQTWRSDAKTVTAAMNRDQIRALIYNVLTLTEYRQYGPFSNGGFPGAGSLEQPHDTVHVDIGGWMPSVRLAAYDPIFWLHHSTIDYYYSLWQTSNPTADYQMNPNKRDPITESLLPFDITPLTPWTSVLVQRSDGASIPTTWLYGYQYPETLESTPSADRKAVADAAIVLLYAPPPKDGSQYPPGANPLDSPPGEVPDLPANAGVRREWRLRIKVKLNLVLPNFAIYFSLGEPEHNHEDWTTASNIVGSFTTFKGKLEQCANCRDHKDALIYGSVILTGPLLDRDRNLGDRANVVKWLKDKLDWRIRQEDGTEIHFGDIDRKGLLVALESYDAAYSPVYEDGRAMPGDLSKILGVTFNQAEHPEVTSPKESKGGATKPRDQYLVDEF